MVGSSDIMARISNEKIMEIRNSVNIVDIISEYVSLSQKGKNYFGLCPFHDDHNPSMSVSEEKQIYTCFVCGATGNVFTFLMEYEHLSFLEAVKLIADKANVLIDISTGVKKTYSYLDKFYDMYDIATKFYQNNLKTAGGSVGRKYLIDRGITKEIISQFGIGVSFSGDKLYKMLIANKYDDKAILQSGLCNSNENGSYDLFTNRIMFPLWNVDGKTVGFSGRIYNRDDSAKYVNSKESQIFKKGYLLYNYHHAKDHVRKAGQVIIVEGFMDVIALYKIGIKNVVATMGTAITTDQARLIKKLSSNVILLFDGDKAGNTATLSCGDELLKLGLTAKIVRLEDELDPDDYIAKYGVDKLKEHLDNSISLLDYKLIMYKEGKNFNNSDDVSEYIKSVIKELDLVKDNIIREVIIQKLSNETGVPTKTLLSLLHKEKVSPIPSTSKSIEEKLKMQNKYEKAYERLLFYMLKSKEVIRMFDDRGVFIPVKEYRYLACEIVSFYKKYGDINLANFIAYLGSKKELINVLSKIQMLLLPEEYSREEIDDYIKVLNDYMTEMEIKRLKDAVNDCNADSDKAELADQIMQLRKEESLNGRD